MQQVLKHRDGMSNQSYCGVLTQDSQASCCVQHPGCLPPEHIQWLGYWVRALASA